MAGEPPVPTDPIPPPSAPGTQKKKGCGGCVVGCLVVIIVAILGLVGGGYYAYHSVMKRIESYPSEFIQKGFAEQKHAESLQVSAPIEGKTLLNAPVVSVNSAADSDLAIVAFVGEANSVVQGNLYFRGAILVVGSEAAIMGDLDVECWALAVEGYVQGEIKGKYQNIDESKRLKTPPEGVEELAPTQSETPESTEPGTEMPAEPPAEPTPPPAETPEPPPAEEAPPAAETPPPAEPPPSAETPPAPPAEPPAADTQPPITNTPPETTPGEELPPATGSTQAEPTPPEPKPVEPAPTPPAPPPPS